MPPAKRQKVSKEDIPTKKSHHEDLDQNDSASEASGSGSDEPPSNLPSDNENDDDSASASPNTEDEIADAKRPKSKKTLKRKYRATDASNFGATLQSLLSTDAPSAAPLSLKPSLARKRNDEKLELRAKKALKVERKDKEDKGRVRDVIGGWGGESERGLRKVAQRGGTFDLFSFGTFSLLFGKMQT